jgi:hypothetical protein
MVSFEASLLVKPVVIVYKVAPLIDFSGSVSVENRHETC